MKFLIFKDGLMPPHPGFLYIEIFFIIKFILISPTIFHLIMIS